MRVWISQSPDGSIARSPNPCGFLQNGDLAGVVELVLGDALQHEIEIVALTGDAVAQARLGQGRNDFDQSIVSAHGLSYGFAPCGFCRFWNGREIIRTFRLTPFSGQPADGGVVPGGDVQNKLPDAVNVWNWFGSGGRGVDILQQIEHCGAVPGIAVKGAAKLFGLESGLGSSDAHRSNFADWKERVNRYMHTR